MTCAIGENWASRCYKTSTETFVSFKDYIHVWWGFKERKQYQHNACKRYHFINVGVSIYTVLIIIITINNIVLHICKLFL